MTNAALTDLALALQTTNDQAFRGIELTFKELTKQVASLTKWVNGGAGDKGVGDGAIKLALRQFFETPKLTGLPQARLLSFGCTVQLSKPEFVLIEDSERFPRFIDGVDQFHRTPKVYRRCYKGLLAAYFSYDPYDVETPKAGSKNWDLLRAYLEVRLKALEDNGRVEWVPAIREHGNLLGENPCDRYAANLLRDDDSLFLEAKTKLEIADTSWVVRRLVIAQIALATQFADTKFQSHIPKLLSLLEQFKYLKDEGLALILNRYGECTGTPLHPELRDISVDAWGNPWITRNSARWSRATDVARNMVTGWLKLKYIEMFFRLLTEDGTADTRRLKYWQAQHEKIDDMYFALGSHARFSLNADFVELRKKMSGRVLELAGAGSPENNAFIMRIGDRIVVEFGSKGNACFVFNHDNLPFRLEGVVRGDSTSLKHDSHEQRLLHTDKRWQTWEQKFSSEIPVLRAGARRTVSTASASAPPRQERPNAAYSRKALNEFCAARNLRIEDLSERGGNLWVRTGNVNSLVAAQLTAWGFRYKDGKGWWRV